MSDAVLATVATPAAQENEIITENDDVPQILQVCEHCKDVIGKTEYYVSMNCGHNTHLSCWNDYMNDDRALCGFCEHPIDFHALHVLNRFKNQNNNLTGHIEHLYAYINKLYNNDSEYRDDVKELCKLRRHVLKSRKELLSEDVKNEIKNIEKLKKDFDEYLLKMKNDLLQSIKSSDKYKNLSKLSLQYRRKFEQFSIKHSHGFDDYLFAKNMQETPEKYFSRTKIRREQFPIDFIKYHLKINRYRFFLYM